MVTLCRASRNTEYWSVPTPQTVGPGSYSSSPLRKALDYTAAPFSSMTARPLSSRAVEETQGSVGETPGPGSYDSTVRHHSTHSSNRGSNSFVTTEARMAPNAPGSTVFSYPTSARNPGPGAYNISKPLAKKRQITRSKPHSLLFEVIGNPASIPPPLIPEPESVPIGPGHYSPSHTYVKPKSTSTDFSHSKDSRRLWEPVNSPFNRLPSRSNPGPGSYDGNSTLTDTEISLGNVSFASKVKRSHQAKVIERSPGPAVYETIERPVLDLVKRPGFGGKVKRGETWRHDLAVPFTKPEKGKYPGVGTYDIDEFCRKEKETKRKNLLYTVIPAVPKAPFLTDQQRDCLIPLQIGSQIGPGTYNPPETINGMSHNLQIGLGKVTFTSKQARFQRQVFEPRVGPAPGQYENERERIRGREIDPVFKSKTMRFPGGEEATPAVGTYEVRGRWRTKQNRAEDYQHVIPGMSFESSSLRFVSPSPLSPKKDSDFPGPGQYQDSLPLSSKGPGVGKSKRFEGFAGYQQVGVTVPTVGPGRYELRSSLLRKSFNRTMEVGRDL